MARYRKATDAEKIEYSASTPAKLYPLVGFIRHKGRDLAVEGLFEGKDEPNYEAMAPEGFHFGREGDACEVCLHSMLGTTLKELIDRVSSEGELTSCEQENR